MNVEIRTFWKEESLLDDEKNKAEEAEHLLDDEMNKAEEAEAFAEKYTSDLSIRAYDEQENVVGFLNADVEDEGVSITSLYVVKECRRMCIASMLMDELVDTLVMHGVMVDVHFTYVMDEESAADIDLAALDAFMRQREDFHVMSDAKEYEVAPEAWRKCKVATHLVKGKYEAQPLATISNITCKKVMSRFKELQIKVAQPGQTLAENYLPNASFVSLNHETKEVAAALLTREIEGKYIELSALYCEKGEETHMMCLMASFAREVMQTYPEHTLRFLTINAASERMVAGIFADISKCRIVNHAIWLGI